MLDELVLWDAGEVKSFARRVEVRATYKHDTSMMLDKRLFSAWFKSEDVMGPTAMMTRENVSRQFRTRFSPSIRVTL